MLSACKCAFSLLSLSTPGQAFDVAYSTPRRRHFKKNALSSTAPSNDTVTKHLCVALSWHRAGKEITRSKGVHTLLGG